MIKDCLTNTNNYNNISENLKIGLEWLKNTSKCDAIILSLDTIAYGGVIPSRRSNDSFEEIKSSIFF